MFIGVTSVLPRETSPELLGYAHPNKETYPDIQSQRIQKTGEPTQERSEGNSVET